MAGFTGTMRLAAGALCLALLSPLDVTAAGAPPQRIVSLNLCTDQLLLALAPRERIAALSFLAADPQSSAYTEEAKGHRLVQGQAEEILPLNPDLILAGTYTTPATIALLKRFGHRVIQVPIAIDLPAIETNITTVAAAIALPERGKALIAKFRASLPTLKPVPARERPVAALFWANGFSSGRGTLTHAVIEAAGFHNHASKIGRPGTHMLPMELLLENQPSLLVIGHPSPHFSLANDMLTHPALRRAFDRKPRIAIPDGLWLCGTPATARAVNMLFEKHRDAISASRRYGQ